MDGETFDQGQQSLARPRLDQSGVYFFYTLFLGIHVLAQELDWPLYYMTDFFLGVGELLFYTA